MLAGREAAPGMSAIVWWERNTFGDPPTEVCRAQKKPGEDVRLVGSAVWGVPRCGAEDTTFGSVSLG
ncbi:MAG: hypothetical protein Fues2KO_39900 [Fuerstiella sp.]